MTVIYDTRGNVYFAGFNVTTPSEIRCEEIEVPEHKQFSGMEFIDGVLQPAFIDTPKSSMDIILNKLEQQQADLDYLKLLSEDV